MLFLQMSEETRPGRKREKRVVIDSCVRGACSICGSFSNNQPHKYGSRFAPRRESDADEPQDGLFFATREPNMTSAKVDHLSHHKSERNMGCEKDF
jgi:hypothetical protein